METLRHTHDTRRVSSAPGGASRSVQWKGADEAAGERSAARRVCDVIVMCVYNTPDRMRRGTVAGGMAVERVQTRTGDARFSR